MSEPVIVLCPGQGAQAVGMGRAWAESSPAAAAVFEEADAVLGDAFGLPLSTICFEGPSETLNRTDVCQPALYACGVASWRGLVAEWGVSPPIAAAAGLSLGEYTALHLADALSFADGLRLVARRGRFMQDAAEAEQSSMVALIGADEEAAEAVCREAAEDGVLVCANFNAPGQIVLSGDRMACARAVDVAGAKGLRARPLTVAGAFHSPLMAPAAERMAEALREVEIRRPSVPVVSNVTAEAHADDAEAIRTRLVEQITSPVRWPACMAWMGEHATGQYHETAPGKVLGGLMRRIDRNRRVTSHDTP